MKWKQVLCSTFRLNWFFRCNEAGKGQAKKFKIKALNENWAWAERKWSQVTADTGIGDPSEATPEKGEKCFNEIVKKIGDLIKELSEADINNMYE